MKKSICVLLLFLFLLPPFLPAQQASLLGGEILSELLDLNLQIESLRKQLETLEQNSISREKLLADLEAGRRRRENLLLQLSQLVDEQAKGYRASLGKWKFSTVLLGSLSAALAGILIYQGVNK